MCVFCKIAKGEIPCYKVYEDDNFLAFLDLSQATKGHTLVIAKEHNDNIFDLDNDSKIFNVVIKVAKGLKEALHIGGINIINNSGPLSGQSINHFHIHLIPRYEGDKVSLIVGETATSDSEFLALAEKIASKIKKNL